MELKHYENNMKYNEDASKNEEEFDDMNFDVIPANTRLQIAVTANDEKASIQRFVSCLNASNF